MNKVLLVGTLSSGPEMRSTVNGRAVCFFSLQVVFKTRVRTELEEIDCVAWDTLAERVGCQGQAGCSMAVEGRLHVRWPAGDRQGPKLTEVVVRDVMFLDKPGSSAAVTA